MAPDAAVFGFTLRYLGLLRVSTFLPAARDGDATLEVTSLLLVSHCPPSLTNNTYFP